MDLWQAAKVGDAERVERLLDRGVPVNRVRWSGITALHRACAEGHIDIVLLLIKRGANVDHRCTMGWYTPLHLACRYGWKECAMALLEADATWRIECKEGKTPLRWAVDAGNMRMGNELETMAKDILREKEKARLEAERQRREKAARAAAAAAVIGLSASRSASHLQDFVEDAVRYAVGRSIANASAMAWGAAVKAWAEYAKAQALIEQCKALEVEPSFFRQLRQELSDEELVELLSSTPEQAKRFGLSKKKFKQLRDYCTYLKII